MMYKITLHLETKRKCIYLHLFPPCPSTNLSSRELFGDFVPLLTAVRFKPSPSFLDARPPCWLTPCSPIVSALLRSSFSVDDSSWHSLFTFDSPTSSFSAFPFSLLLVIDETSEYVPSRDMLDRKLRAASLLLERYFWCLREELAIRNRLLSRVTLSWVVHASGRRTNDVC